MSSNIKILHAPVNIAGGAYIVAKAQAELGYYAKSYDFTGNQNSHWSSDYSNFSRFPWYGKYKNALRLGLEFDVFQFWFGYSLLGHSLEDLKILKRLGKKMFFYFCGCDIRDEKATIMNHPISACSHCFPKLCSSNRPQALAAAQEYSKANFVSTPDLLEFVPGSILMPQPIDLKALQSLADLGYMQDPSKLVVGHAPSSRSLKGTGYIFKAIKELQTEGYPIELKLIEGMNHIDAMRAYSRVDVVIDQLLFGAYGTLAAETMALGKPTIVYLRPDVEKLYEVSPPVINANPLNIKQILIDVINAKYDLEKLSKRSYLYAAETHDSLKISRKLLEYYLN